MAGKRGRALTSGERAQAMGILTEARSVSRTGYYASFRDFAWRELKGDPEVAHLMQADPTSARWSSSDTKSAAVIRCVVTRADGSQVTEMRTIDFEHLTRLTDQPFKRHSEAGGTKPNLSPMLADANRYYQEALRDIGHAHWFTNDAIESFVVEHQLYPDRSPARTDLGFNAVG
jgi:hypothetical protein